MHYESVGEKLVRIFVKAKYSTCYLSRKQFQYSYVYIRIAWRTASTIMNALKLSAFRIWTKYSAFDSYLTSYFEEKGLNQHSVRTTWGNLHILHTGSSGLFRENMRIYEMLLAYESFEEVWKWKTKCVATFSAFEKKNVAVHVSLFPFSPPGIEWSGYRLRRKADQPASNFSSSGSFFNGSFHRQQQLRQLSQ